MVERFIHWERVTAANLVEVNRDTTWEQKAPSSTAMISMGGSAWTWLELRSHSGEGGATMVRMLGWEAPLWFNDHWEEGWDRLDMAYGLRFP